LDTAVEAFAFGVGDAMAEVSQEMIQVTIQSLGYRDDRLQATTRCPAVPFAKMLLGILCVRIVPKPAELFLDGPGSRRLQLQVLQVGETQRLRFAEVVRIEKPKLFRAGQRRLAIDKGEASGVAGQKSALVGHWSVAE